MEKVQDKASLIRVLKMNKEKVLSFGVARIGIFGSFSRDEMSAESDIDFFVEFNPGSHTFDNFMDLAFFLKEITGRDIELVTPGSVSPFMGPEILKEVNYVLAA